VLDQFERILGEKSREKKGKTWLTVVEIVMIFGRPWGAEMKEYLRRKYFGEFK
jgi:hypothetical protein